MVTRAAMTVSCTIMRMRPGTPLRSKEMARLLKAATKVTAMAMTMEGFSAAVTARALQMPSTCTVTGLLSLKGSVSSRRSFLPKSGAEVVAVSAMAQEFFRVWKYGR
jgi:hypothetical protein